MEYLNEGYWKYAVTQVPRLLNLVDRDYYSDSRGCFDRAYWHQKIKDFPSAANQMGIHCLAIVYAKEGSIYFKEKYILEILEMGIEYLEKIQKKDGSFDEWYVNERGWAGPTGYLVHSCCRVHEIMNDSLSEKIKTKLEKIIFSGAKHLCVAYETQVITNHLAIALTALFEAHQISGNKEFKQSYEKQKSEMLKNHTAEGWSLEYDGPDIGYQSATVSFLTHIHKTSNDKEIEKLSLESLSFI
jgi:hypothetical protein